MILVGVLGTAACGPAQSGGGPSNGGVVHVLGSWAGSEQDSFLAMVKPFEQRTGIKIQYEGTRNLNAVLTSRVQAGNPPELAGLPGPGQMAELAMTGKLVALDGALDQRAFDEQYAPDLARLGQVDARGQLGSGKTYGIFVKAALKGLVWYDPKNFQAQGFRIPSTWDQMLDLQNQMVSSGTAPWSIGLDSSASTGWPGSDWVTEILLGQWGPEVYDRWWSGKLKWTSPEIKQAWQTWGDQILGPKQSHVYGGNLYMRSTSFGDAGEPLFSSPPRAYMHNQGSFITDFFVRYSGSPKPGEDFKFFGLPEVTGRGSGSRVVAGDLFGMFKGTDQARQLIKYLTTPEAQAIWVKRGGAISLNKKVPLSDYPDDVSRSVRQMMVSTRTPRFDAGDLMPGAMQNAFWAAVNAYVENPSQLDSILANLDSVQARAYK